MDVPPSHDGGSLPHVYDRAYLLHGAKRNEVLTLAEVQQYGLDSFLDADYVSMYGMRPEEWHSRGVRVLGRTAVECTRDALGDRSGRPILSPSRKNAKPVAYCLSSSVDKRRQHAAQAGGDD